MENLDGSGMERQRAALSPGETLQPHHGLSLADEGPHRGSEGVLSTDEALTGS